MLTGLRQWLERHCLPAPKTVCASLGLWLLSWQHPSETSRPSCTTPTSALLAQKLAEIAPQNVNQVFFGSSGSEANDTALRLVRHYWALEGRPSKNRIISR